ncbi:ATPase [Frigidibacter sp. ROC022]|uniref:ATPase n=1 Tax=Frigidibacter sp. ROC022 TaxID=2971796 RepID=UPI00215A5A3D|nr:ATPase [Frigidibacter sp. ROC022]MCR8726398.1 ATPase [Frigidibacter sp. ROC022]
MIHQTADDWRNSRQKHVLLFGMSGLGKTRLSSILREAGDWFHYSIDYRIGTRYMGEHIADNFKAEAMKNPFLANLLRTDSVYISSNITFDNLAPLSTYLGKPGDPAKGGLPFAEYMRRQALHAEAEIASLRDTVRFIDRARTLYGYDSFICDSSGSICEVVDPWDDADPVLELLSQHLLLVWIEGTEEHTEELIRRARKQPKPMYYSPGFLTESWQDYMRENNVLEDEVDPDDFTRATFAKALKRRRPRYAEMARRWGLKVSAEATASVRDPADFEAMIADALDARMRG